MKNKDEEENYSILDEETDEEDYTFSDEETEDNSNSAYQEYKKQAEAEIYPSVKEEKDLFMKYKKGNKELKNEIVKTYLFTVFYVVERYHTFENEYNKMDLVEAGILGLYHAIDKFDISKETRFITYADYWVRSYVQKESFFLKNRVTMAPHMSLEYKYALIKKQDISKPTKNTKQLIHEYYGTKKYNNYVKAYNVREAVSLDDNANTYTLKLRYLNSLMGNDDTVLKEPISELVEDINQTLLEEKIIDKVLVQQILNWTYLTEREKEVLIRRFIYEEGLKEIGKSFGVSHETVRTIQNNAIEKVNRRCYYGNYINR